MAKVNGPIHSESVSGAFANLVTFSLRKNGQHVRLQQKQKDVITSKRVVQRFKFSQGLILWHSLPDSEKNKWKLFAKQGYLYE